MRANYLNTGPIKHQDTVFLHNDSTAVSQCRFIVKRGPVDKVQRVDCSVKRPSLKGEIAYSWKDVYGGERKLTGVGHVNVGHVPGKTEKPSASELGHVVVDEAFHKNDVGSRTAVNVDCASRANGKALGNV